MCSFLQFAQHLCSPLDAPHSLFSIGYSMPPDPHWSLPMSVHTNVLHSLTTLRPTLLFHTDHSTTCIYGTLEKCISQISDFHHHVCGQAMIPTVLPTSDGELRGTGDPLTVTLASANITIVSLARLVVGHFHTTLPASSPTEPRGTAGVWVQRCFQNLVAYPLSPHDLRQVSANF